MPFTANYSSVFAQLPELLDFSAIPLQPEAILQRRMVRKSNAVVPQINMNWQDGPAEDATFEDHHVLRTRFPASLLCGGACSQGVRGV